MLVVAAVLKEQEQMEVVVDQVVVDQDQNQLAQVLLYLKEYQEMQEQVEVVAELMLHQEHQVKQVVQVEAELLLQKN
jgi:glyceraldehyde-3-phosphate dehydrogenase/erythrose-4-phosphate dehydrogenase